MDFFNTLASHHVMDNLDCTFLRSESFPCRLLPYDTMYTHNGERERRVIKKQNRRDSIVQQG